MDARSRREWEQQMREWEQAQMQESRFEELDSDYESDPDRLYFTGYDTGSGRQGMRGTQYGAAYGEDEDEDEYYDEGAEWQLAMREKEEGLARRAYRRIQRARLRGESNVDLTREELDALERRESRQAVVRSSNPRSAPASQAQRKTSRQSYAGRPVGPTVKTTKRISVPVESRTAGASSSAIPISSDDSPKNYSPPTTSGQTSPRASRPNSRSASNQSRKLQQSGSGPTAAPYHDQAQSGFRPSSSSSSLSIRRRDISPTRSLPDDPDWVPTVRSRSSSSVHLQPHPSADPFTYQVGAQGPSRRNISGPAAVGGVPYSGVRRAPPTAGGSRMPSDERLIPSSLSREVIEISSDEDDDSDEGVSVDPAPSGGYSTHAAVSRGGGAAGGRLRRGRR